MRRRRGRGRRVRKRRGRGGRGREEEGGEEEGGEEEGGEEEGGEGGEEVHRKSTSTCTEMTNIIRWKHSCLQPDCSVVDITAHITMQHSCCPLQHFLTPNTGLSNTPKNPMQTTTLPRLADHYVAGSNVRGLTFRVPSTAGTA